MSRLIRWAASGEPRPEAGPSRCRPSNRHAGGGEDGHVLVLGDHEAWCCAAKLLDVMQVSPAPKLCGVCAGYAVT